MTCSPSPSAPTESARLGASVPTMSARLGASASTVPALASSPGPTTSPPGRAAARRSRLLAWTLLLGAPVLFGCSQRDILYDETSDLFVYGMRIWNGTAANMGSFPSLAQFAEGRMVSFFPMREEEEVLRMARKRRAEVVDATGLFMIPGLINVHGHVGGTWSAETGVEYADYAKAELERYARFGVTTVASMGGGRPGSFAIRDASWGDASPERARLLASGAVVTGETPEEAVAAVDEAVQHSPDWIKIRVDDNLGTVPKMLPDVYQAVIDRAGHHELRVASHLFYQEDAKGLLRSGTGLVAHSIRDQEVDDETIALFLETGVCYVPTLTREVSAFAYGERPEFLDDPFLTADVDSAQVRVVSDPDRQERIRQSPQPAAYREALRIAQHNLKRLADAGVTIAFGTDSGPTGRFQGYFEHMEMELMAEAGLTPKQILRSATEKAAGCLGRSDIGVLEPGRGQLVPGRWADFILLRADPLEDVRNARQIESVWVGGKRISR